MLRFHSRSIAAFAVALVLTAAIAIAATPVRAATDPEVRTAVVSYGDLDLTRSQGVWVLKRRIADAVERVCGAASRMTIAEQQIYRACAAEAAADAHEQVAQAVQAAAQASAVTTASR